MIRTDRDVYAGGVAPLRSLIESLDWPEGCQPHSLRLGRVWAGRKGRITIEHLVRLREGNTFGGYAIQGFFSRRVRSVDSPSLKPRWVDGHVLGVHAVDRERGCSIFSPDCDPDLPALRMFCDSAPLAGVLMHDSLRPHLESVRLVDADQARATLVSYRCARRFVVRIEGRRGDSSGLYVKGMRRMPSSSSLESAHSRIETLRQRSQGLVQAPDLLSVIPEWKFLCFAEVPREAVHTGYGDDDLKLAARVAGLIHDLPLSAADRQHTPLDEFGTVSRWQPVLSFLHPQEPNPLDGLVELLRSQTPDDASDCTRVIHRDFYNAQMLSDGQSVWLVDWDTMCLGHPELDIATYTAHAVFDDILNGRSASAWRDRLALFLDHYVKYGGIYDRRRLQWYVAGALTRISAMHTARWHPPEVLEPLWTAARSACESLNGNARTSG